MSREMKDSGIQIIGEIPDDMNVIRIKFVANIFGRIGFRGYTQDDIVNDGEGAISLSPSNLKSFRMSYDKRTYISWSKYEESPEIKIENGDILFVKTGSSYGKSCIVKGLPEKATINPQLIVFKNIKCNNKYLFYLLQTSIVDAQTQWHVTGGTIPTMSQDKIANFYLPYYKDDYEQQQIVHFLDRKCTAIDTAIEKTKKSIKKLEEYKKAVITKAVTKGIDPNAKMKDSGVEWCPQIPEHWSVVNPKALFSQRTERILPGDKQLTASQEHGVIYQDEYTKATGSRVVAVIRDFSILKHVEPNDFVISMRSFQGGLEYSEKRGCISSAYVMLIPNTKYVYPLFYRWFFKSSKYINALQSTSNFVRDGQAMRYSHFIQIPLFVIPLTEQRQIANYLEAKVNAIMVLIQKKQMAIAKWEEYKKSLIYYAVTGKIDCRNEVI